MVICSDKAIYVPSRAHEIKESDISEHFQGMDPSFIVEAMRWLAYCVVKTPSSWRGESHMRPPYDEAQTSEAQDDVHLFQMS